MIMKTIFHHGSRAQQGSVLLEGLISILLFSVGILAIVGMQAAAIKNTSDAKYRADASYFANQIIGQMWADRANLPSYNNNAIAGTAPCNPTGTLSIYPNVTGWLNAVTTSLPNAVSGVQQIVVNAAANNLVTVTVCWKPPQATTWHNFVATAQIN
ncbi:MAG: putative Tfp pilus assembly protein PilV [Candidatus Gallionella acididurans]|uniref:Putative Tfp pilus assembly protein PilV n=1 Tax=Candidatus Gallionella acididurans TaxID=1796491 RepID=A0A139BSF9_9PROT|nr:MAG: putative Tfp pilus assembly protein PilV [Candidatus Gallionella acididurans]